MKQDDSHGGYLGTGATIRGRLETSGDFHINGTFLGEIHAGQLVSVGVGGLVEGEIHADRIVLDGGTVKGLLQAKSVEVRPESRLVAVRMKAESLHLDASTHSEGARFEVGAKPEAGTTSPSS